MTDEARETVAVVLMKSEEADATLAVLRRDCPQVRISDHGTFWMLKAEDEIAVDLEQVATELGRPLSLAQWLVIMTSYVGRVETEQNSFLVTAKMSQLEPDGLS
jgi:hypothetical protein